MEHLNFKGEDITGKEYQLLKPEYGMVALDGSLKVFWEDFIENGNPEGFDSSHPIEHVILSPGTQLIRYGNDGGRYTAPYGTTYEELSLPYKKESVEYHEYTVMEPTEVGLACSVDKGVVAKGFGQIGGGIQYRHSEPMSELVHKGILKEDVTWITA